MAMAQPSVPGKGQLQVSVANPKQSPLPFSTVELLRPQDSSLLKVLVTDSLGTAVFDNLSPGNYLLRISRINFSLQYSQLNFTTDESTPVPVTIVLQPASGALQEVVVTGRKPFVVQAAGKTIINVDASIGNVGTTVLEVLERSPGVTVDKDGNISLKGRPDVLVMIDNKPSYVSGAELATLLSGMSSNQVEVIELIENPSARYDAAGNAGIINIVTKKNKQSGFNGNLSLAYTQGRYARNNNSLQLNFRNGAFNFFVNYSNNFGRNYVDLYAFRTYYNQGGQGVASYLEQPTYITALGKTHNLRAGADYYLNKKTTLGIVLTGTDLSRNRTGSGTADWKTESGSIDSTILTENNSSTHWQNAGLNFNARHNFSSSSELMADVDFIGYRITSDQSFQNSLDGGYVENYKGDLPSEIRIFSAKADYTASFSNGLKLESGLKTSHISTDNNAIYFYKNGNEWMDDLNKTNHFLYEETINAVYGSLQKKTGKWNVQAGLRFENTAYQAQQLGNTSRKDSSFSRNYSSLFPSSFITYQLDSSNQLSFTAGRRIDRPPFQKLNPFVIILNKYTNQTGNPYIRPQYTWNMELSHIYKETITTSVGYNYIHDYFSQLFFSDTSGNIIYTEGNLGKMQNLSLSVSAQLNPYNWWSISADATLNHKKLEGFVWKNETASITEMNFNLNNQFRFKQGWSAELSGYYITKSQTDIQEVLEPTGQLSLGLAKQVLKNKGSLKLSFRDIFYTQAMAGYTKFQHAGEYFKLTRDSRVITLAFSLRFGKPLKGPGKRNNGGADDEIQRVGSGS
jgi:iron complex outermembrane receptor protein